MNGYFFTFIISLFNPFSDQPEIGENTIEQVKTEDETWHVKVKKCFHSFNSTHAAGKAN